MKLLFLDESGDHSLDHFDSSYPVFVLGGIVVDRLYYRSVMEPKVRTFKESFFGNDAPILHTTDIIRRKNGYERLNDPGIRAPFFMELNALMAELEYSAVACAIQKHRFLAVESTRGADPYTVCLERVIDIFCECLDPHENAGAIFAEKRRPDLDEALDQHWQKMRRVGTAQVSGPLLDHRIVDLSLKSKRINSIGLQVADLVVSPIGRYLIGKEGRPDWEIVQQKLWTAPSSAQRRGLVILPEE